MRWPCINIQSCQSRRVVRRLILDSEVRLSSLKSRSLAAIGVRKAEQVPMPAFFTEFVQSKCEIIVRGVKHRLGQRLLEYGNRTGEIRSSVRGGTQKDRPLIRFRFHNSHADTQMKSSSPIPNYA